MSRIAAGSGMDVMLVEDNPADREFVLEWLAEKSAPLSLSAYENGTAALDYLKQASEGKSHPLPKLILLDLNLPGIKGLDILRQLKSDPALRKIPVVIFSSSFATSDIAQSYDAHANAYMTKGADLAEMYAALDEIHEYWFEQAYLPG